MLQWLQQQYSNSSSSSTTQSNVSRSPPTKTPPRPSRQTTKMPSSPGKTQQQQQQQRKRMKEGDSHESSALSQDTDFNDQGVRSRDADIVCCGYLFLPTVDMLQRLTQNVAAIAHGSAGIMTLGESATSADHKRVVAPHHRDHHHHHHHHHHQYSGGGRGGRGGNFNSNGRDGYGHLHRSSNLSGNSSTSGSNSSSSSIGSPSGFSGNNARVLEYTLTRSNPHCITASAPGGISNPFTQKIQRSMQLLRQRDSCWNRLWFELRENGMLSYFDSKAHAKMRGSMMLENFYVQHSKELYPDLWCFSLIFPNTGSAQLNATSAVTVLYFLRAKTKHEMKQWMRYLSRLSGVERENKILETVDQKVIENERQRNEISQKHQDHGGRDVRLKYYRQLLAPTRTHRHTHLLHISSQLSTVNNTSSVVSPSLLVQESPSSILSPPRSSSREHSHYNGGKTKYSGDENISSSNGSCSTSSSAEDNGFSISNSDNGSSGNDNDNIFGTTQYNDTLRDEPRIDIPNPTVSPGRKKRMLLQRIQQQQQRQRQRQQIQQGLTTNATTTDYQTETRTKTG